MKGLEGVKVGDELTAVLRSVQKIARTIGLVVPEQAAELSAEVLAEVVFQAVYDVEVNAYRRGEKDGRYARP